MRLGRSSTISAKAKEAHLMRPSRQTIFLTALSAQSAAKIPSYSGGAILLLRSSLATMPSLICTTR